MRALVLFEVDEMEEELKAICAQRQALSGGSNKKAKKKARQKLDKKIRELESSIALASSSSTRTTEGGGQPKRSITLDSSTLPPFDPPTRQVNCINGPMSPLQWAFTCSVPPLLRPQIISSGNPGDLASNVSPNLQWNYSMFHLAHHYETDSTIKFTIQDDSATAAILLQITGLKSCPDSYGEMGELMKSDFCTPGEDDSSLGPVPLFFVRYFYQTKSNWAGSVRAKAMQPGGAIYEHSNGGGPFVTIRAASVKEVEFAHKELQRGQQFLSAVSRSSNHEGKFEESVLFPPAMKGLLNKKATKAKKICAFCEKRPNEGRSLCSCSRCKVTFYCSKLCQRDHWKAGHKNVCLESGTSADVEAASESTRPSFTFDALTESVAGHREDSGNAPMYVTQNYRTGRMESNFAERSGSRTGMGKIPKTRNVYGEKEFIVKIQIPLPLPGGPSDWMCYDGPTRSFQATVPVDTTTGLKDAKAVLEKEGIWSIHPQYGIPGVKGYFVAKWEGSRIRVYYDRLAPPQSW